MSNIPEDQITEWLKKLERESWQLELLVSAFTIFLLIQATVAFDDFITDIEFQYNFQSSRYSMLYLFLGLIHKSLEALVFCLVSHLMLRGFWIGTIGLRSVQSNIDFSSLNYSSFFTEKLKKKVISLDQLVIKLDEICSVIFAFAFLVISILMAFGLYLLFLGLVALVLSAIGSLSPEWMDQFLVVTFLIILLTLMFSGLIYMVDYFTLGFIKKIKWLSRVYYPFYRFYNVITLSVLSRSIYYYMISKFSKKRIRLVYAVAATLLFFSLIFRFDQHPYYPERHSAFGMTSNHYDNLRPEEDYVVRASIASDYVDKPHFKLFIRYDARDNELINSHCEGFTPMKEDGLNWRFRTEFKNNNLHIGDQKFADEDLDKILSCLCSIYQISINDSVYNDLKYRFYTHPARDQRGIITSIPTDDFLDGENVLEIKKILIDSAGVKTPDDYTIIPFWYQAPAN